MELNWLPHPILIPPDFSDLDPDNPEDFEWIKKAHEEYHELIRLSRDDPYRHGFVLPHWQELLDDFYDVDEQWVFGGNRSSKSAVSAWLVVQALVKNPGSRIICWSQNDEISKTLQQPYIYSALPKEMKRKQRDEIAKVVYSRANGFTDKTFILGNGSQCLFKTYSQFANNNNCIEGIELGWKSLDGEEAPFLNLGNWFDEYLGDPTLLETMRLRLSTLNSKNLVTFTPIDGFTETVRTVLEGAETVREKSAELLDGQMVPIVQRPKNGNRLLRYFHTADNPFNDWSRFRRDMEGLPRQQVMVRAYGVPTKGSTTVFPKFQRHINVRPAVEEIKGGTNYCIIDPAGAKNWFIVWINVDETDTWRVYREWPDRNTYGPWAEYGKPQNGRAGQSKWRAGPAQKGMGYGIQDYIDLIKGLEGDEKILERLIDPRLGAAQYADTVGTSSIIQDLDDKGMVCIPAPGVHISDGLQLIMGKMSWDDTRELDALNRPHFYISEDCGNTIAALGDYDVDGGKDDANKDPVDCLRYAGVGDIAHVGEEMMDVYRVGSGGY